MLAGDTLASHRAMCTSAAVRNAAIFSAGAPTIRMREISLSSACFIVYWKVEESALHWASRITQSRCLVSPSSNRLRSSGALRCRLPRTSMMMTAVADR